MPVGKLFETIFVGFANDPTMASYAATALIASHEAGFYAASDRRHIVRVCPPSQLRTLLGQYDGVAPGVELYWTVRNIMERLAREGRRAGEARAALLLDGFAHERPQTLAALAALLQRRPAGQ